MEAAGAASAEEAAAEEAEEAAAEEAAAEEAAAEDSRRVISEISFLDLHVNHFFSVDRASATRPKVLPTAWS